MIIDVVVFLAGNNLDIYTPLFIESLQTRCDTTEINLHVVEKGRFSVWNPSLDLKNYIPGVGDSVHNYLVKKKEENKFPITIYEMHDPSTFFNSSIPGTPGYDLACDHAETCNWAMKNCGSNKYVLLCHYWRDRLQ